MHLVSILLPELLLRREQRVLRGRHLRCLLLVQEHLLLLLGEVECLWLLLVWVLWVIPALSVVLIHDSFWSVRNCKFGRNANGIVL